MMAQRGREMLGPLMPLILVLQLSSTFSSDFHLTKTSNFGFVHSLFVYYRLSESVNS